MNTALVLLAVVIVVVLLWRHFRIWQRVKDAVSSAETRFRFWAVDRLLPAGYVSAHFDLTQAHIDESVETARAEAAQRASIIGFEAGWRAAKKANMTYKIASNRRKINIGQSINGSIVPMWSLDTVKCEIKGTKYAADEKKVVQPQAMSISSPVPDWPEPNYESVAANVMP